MINLLDYKELIDDKPIHIATVDKSNNPNLAVASDVKVLGENEIIVSVNEMTNTQENIKNNPNTVITVFDKKWIGLRMFGTAKYYSEGKYYDFCLKTFFSKGQITPFGATKPKGAIVVKMQRIEKYE